MVSAEEDFKLLAVGAAFACIPLGRGQPRSTFMAASEIAAGLRQAQGVKSRFNNPQTYIVNSSEIYL
jgi:hypothetical protein